MKLLKLQIGQMKVLKKSIVIKLINLILSQFISLHRVL